MNASIFADLSVGYDSRGIETGNFFDGFYFGDREEVFVGQDIDEFGLSLGVSLAALLDLVVASAGVEGVRQWDPGAGEEPDPIGELGSFVTPTLRGVSRTGPYMHNGALPDLWAVVEFYNFGGHSEGFVRRPSRTAKILELWRWNLCGSHYGN